MATNIPPPPPPCTGSLISLSLHLGCLCDLFCPTDAAQVGIMWLSSLSLRRLCSLHICPFRSQPPCTEGQARLLNDEARERERETEGAHPKGNPSPLANIPHRGPRRVSKAILDFPATGERPQHRKKRDSRPVTALPATQLRPLTSQSREMMAAEPHFNL